MNIFYFIVFLSFTTTGLDMKKRKHPTISCKVYHWQDMDCSWITPRQLLPFVLYWTVNPYADPTIFYSCPMSYIRDDISGCWWNDTSLFSDMTYFMFLHNSYEETDPQRFETRYLVYPPTVRELKSIVSSRSIFLYWLRPDIYTFRKLAFTVKWCVVEQPINCQSIQTTSLNIMIQNTSLDREYNISVTCIPRHRNWTLPKNDPHSYYVRGFYSVAKYIIV